MTKSRMIRKLSDSQHTNPTKREIEAAIRALADEGLIYDTGQRRWSERFQEYQIVWATIESRTLN
jgi:hypothetical protein